MKKIENYENLLVTQNLVDWLLSLSNSPSLKNDIRYPALELAYDISGNKFISNTPFYKPLFSKFEFQIKQDKVGDGNTLGYILYQYIPSLNKLTYIGNVKGPISDLESVFKKYRINVYGITN